MLIKTAIWNAWLMLQGKVGLSLGFAGHLLPGCLVSETGVSCWEWVDERMFIVRYGAERGAVSQVNLTPSTVDFSKALGLTQHPVFSIS